MNIIRKYRNQKRLSVIAGILLAFIIVTTQASVYYFAEGSSAAYHVDEEQNEQTPQFLSQDAVAVSSVQLNLDKPFQVVFELLLPEDEQKIAKPENLSFCLEFFKNLFRVTISPNAP